MALTESQYVPNGRTIMNAFAFDDTGTFVLTRDINGRVVMVGKLTTTPQEIWAYDPALVAQYMDVPVGLRIPRYTVATLPAAGIAGRIAYTTDDNNFKIDTGSVWQAVAIFTT